MFVRDAGLRTSLNARNTITVGGVGAVLTAVIQQAAVQIDRTDGRERPPVVVRTLGRWACAVTWAPAGARSHNRHAPEVRLLVPERVAAGVSRASTMGPHAGIARGAQCTQQSKFHSPRGTCRQE